MIFFFSFEKRSHSRQSFWQSWKSSKKKKREENPHWKLCSPTTLSLFPISPVWAQERNEKSPLSVEIVAKRKSVLKEFWKKTLLSLWLQACPTPPGPSITSPGPTKELVGQRSKNKLLEAIKAKDHWLDQVHLYLQYPVKHPRCALHLLHLPTNKDFPENLWSSDNKVSKVEVRCNPTSTYCANKWNRQVSKIGEFQESNNLWILDFCTKDKEDKLKLLGNFFRTNFFALFFHTNFFWLF